MQEPHGKGPFMKIKNYQEDIVLHAISVLMEDQPDLRNDQTFINDVAAYVLNRMSPKYIMSERGFTRLAVSHLLENGNGEGISDLVELMALFNRYGLSLRQFALFPRLRSVHQNPETVPQWWQPKVFR